MFTFESNRRYTFDVLRLSFVLYGCLVNRCALWHLPAAENGTMHMPEKLQFPDVSDTPTVLLSQGRARRIHNRSWYELRVRILEYSELRRVKHVTPRRNERANFFSFLHFTLARTIKRFCKIEIVKWVAFKN